jgi:hypothetical protein
MDGDCHLKIYVFWSSEIKMICLNNVRLCTLLDVIKQKLDGKMDPLCFT